MKSIGDFAIEKKHLEAEGAQRAQNALERVQQARRRGQEVEQVLAARIRGDLPPDFQFAEDGFVNHFDNSGVKSFYSVARPSPLLGLLRPAKWIGVEFMNKADREKGLSMYVSGTYQEMSSGGTELATAWVAVAVVPWRVASTPSERRDGASVVCHPVTFVGIANESDLLNDQVTPEELVDRAWERVAQAIGTLIPRAQSPGYQADATRVIGLVVALSVAGVIAACAGL